MTIVKKNKLCCYFVLFWK